MARTAISETALALNALATPVSNNVDPTNGHTMSLKKGRKLVLRLNYTFAGAKTFTVKAGAYPPSWAKGQGDLVLSLNAVVRYLVIDAGRFAQADGTLWFDVEAAATGTIEALRLPADL